VDSSRGLGWFLSEELWWGLKRGGLRTAGAVDLQDSRQSRRAAGIQRPYPRERAPKQVADDLPLERGIGEPADHAAGRLFGRPVKDAIGRRGRAPRAP